MFVWTAEFIYVTIHSWRFHGSPFHRLARPLSGLLRGTCNARNRSVYRQSPPLPVSRVE